MQTVNVVSVKRYFDKHKVTYYSDGTYSFENYVERFKDLLHCITWGNAMDKAKADRADALKRIKKLECDPTILEN